MINIPNLLRKVLDGTYRRSRTPTVFQMEATECGAACLAIILGYYGKFIPLSEAREECDVNRDGAKATHIMQAAHLHGLDAIGYSYEIEDLEEMKLPAIIHWKFTHFLVIEGWNSRKIYLNDPATGPRTVSWDEFQKYFTGVGIEFEPTSDFKRGGEPPKSTFRLLSEWLQAGRKVFLFLGIVSLLLGMLSIFPAIVMKIFIDSVLISNQWAWSPYIIAFLLGVALFSALLSWMQQYYLRRYILKTKATGSASFLKKILQLPITFFQQRVSGDVAMRMETYHESATFISEDLVMAPVILVMSGFYAMAMFMLSQELAWAVLFLASINFACISLIQRKISDFGQCMLHEKGHLMGIEVLTLNNMEYLKANALDLYYFRRWAAQQAHEIAATQKFVVYTSILEMLPVIFLSINVLLVVGLGGFLVLKGMLTIGGLIAIQALSAGFYQPMTRFFGSVASFFELKGALFRIVDVLHYPIPEPFGEALTSQYPDPILSLENVTFGYSRREPPLLDDFSLRIMRGMQVSIVGNTGSGKSTLLKLICGLYAVWSGAIYCEGRQLRFNEARRAEGIGYVGQNIYLFEGSLRENLTLWDHSIKDAALNEVLRDLKIFHLFAERGGLDAHIEAGGKNFSTGQKQRIEIARAFLLHSKLLILDEATSALDGISEALVYKTLKKYTESALIVAHRLTSVKHCDHICVMAHGKIIESGTHENLIEKQGAYYALAKQEMFEL